MNKKSKEIVSHAVYSTTGNVIGVVIDDTFHKRVNSSKHFLRKPPAIAFDERSILDAEKLGASKLMVHDKDTKRRYMASYKEFALNSFEVNRGFGKQQALPIAYWRVLDPKQMTMFKS